MSDQCLECDRLRATLGEAVREADGRAACFEQNANDYKARVETLERTLREISTSQDGAVRPSARRLAALAQDALSTTPPKLAPRPDVTEALRVAMEALEKSDRALSNVLCGLGARVEGLAARDAARTALALLRAHVEPKNQPVEQGTKS